MGVLATSAIVSAIVLALLLGAVRAAAQPIDMAAPYEYMGWGDPQAPETVMAATGIRDFTLAFILSKGQCDPEWDGRRPLLGGVDERTIESIRAAGGEVVVSFGGWSGHKLGSACRTPGALAAAYEKVIAAYSLHAIDVDIEHTEFTARKIRERVAQALAQVQREDPGIEISITMGTEQDGPERDGISLIDDAAAIGLMPTAWTIMPFDFGPAPDMAATSIAAVQALARDVASAYDVTLTDAYAHSGISSMNGETDESGETVSLEDWARMLGFATQNDLARMTFWAVNRDRPCQAHPAPEEECSGVVQEPLAFTTLLAGYSG